jgi:hypothetical protein
MSRPLAATLPSDVSPPPHATNRIASVSPDSRLVPPIGASPEVPDRHSAGLTCAADRALEHRHLTAIRVARLTLLDAARRGNAVEVEAGIAPFVRAMWEADFSRPTICSLVAAAIDSGLATARGAARRAQRTQALDRWERLAAAIVDELLAR